jgi:endogenous inhibitor of DNA gyrase (YacG/DUF329 family)
MSHTSDPVACPHCGASIHRYEDVLTMTRVSKMIVVACASCRKVLGVLPREEN